MMTPMRVAMLLPGLGRVQRGAETAFIEIARGLVEETGAQVELFGTGHDGVDGLRMNSVGCVRRERFEGWPRAPCFRSETYYEELSFVLSLAARRRFRPRDFDVVVGCTYPYINWFLGMTCGRSGPARVFVTQNGDWPCRREGSEFRAFSCDGLVCTNPVYYETNKDRYPSALIPNGVDPDVFRPPGIDSDGVLDDPRIPRDRPVVLMAGALSPEKRALDGVRAVARVPGLFMVMVGDGPQRREVAALAAECLPGRHLLLGNVPRARMAGVFRRASVFLHMRQDEPFGIVYLEAASTGLAVVAHDGPVPRWILGETALYADTSDLDAVAAALRQATLAATTPALGEAARRRVVKDWTWRRQSRKYREFFEHLTAEARGRSRRVVPGPLGRTSQTIDSLKDAQA